MPKVPDGLVISHWHKPFDKFQASTQDVYRAVEAAVARRQLPDTKASRVVYNESGVLSTGREYLRFERKGQRMDLCAAPFGTGYFFSSWLTEPAPSGLLYLMLFLAISLGLLWLIFYSLGFAMGLLASIAIYPLLFYGLGTAVRDGTIPAEPIVLAMPIIGKLYEVLLQPVTYYRMDTALMFQSTIHSAFLEVIDGLTTAQGIRALSELERTPIMKQFGEIPTEAGIASDYKDGAPAHTA